MNATKEEIESREAEIRHKRTQTLIGAWEMMKRKYPEMEGAAFLHSGQVVHVVENYLQERQRWVSRDNIRGRIQRHKIAGLMAASIVRLRPIQLRDDTGRDARVSKDNEALAVLHGLAICAEGHDEQAKALFQLPVSGVWLTDFIYQLRLFPADCGTWCSMVFETLGLTHFPKTLDKVSPWPEREPVTSDGEMPRKVVAGQIK